VIGAGALASPGSSDLPLPELWSPPNPGAPGVVGALPFSWNAAGLMLLLLAGFFSAAGFPGMPEDATICGASGTGGASSVLFQAL
jgi:hypothetical protein